MPKNDRPWLGRIVFLLYCLLLVFLIPGLLAPWIPLDVFPEAQLLSAILVYTVPLQALSLPFLYRRKIVRWVILLMLLVTVWVGRKDIQIRPEPDLQQPGLRIASYNVAAFRFQSKQVGKVAELLAPEKPDVVIFQEFRNQRLPDGRYARQLIQQKLDLPHFRFERWRGNVHGTAIFSRYPIVRIDTLFISGKEINSGLVFTLQTENGKIGIAGMHLSSFHFRQVLNPELGFLENLKLLHQQLQKVMQQHAGQLDMVVEKTADYPHPLILAGDLNSTPHSRAIHRLGKAFDDSFNHAGSGLGVTFQVIGAAGVRIDYLMSKDPLKPVAHKILQSDASDHFGVLAIFQPDPD